MAKFRKFQYSAGYIGTDTEVIMEFSDDYTEEQINDIFEGWVDEQHCWSSECTEVDESEVDENEIEDRYE